MLTSHLLTSPLVLIKSINTASFYCFLIFCVIVGKKTKILSDKGD